MSARFKEIDHNQRLLLPPDLREWVPADDLVHFVLATVDGLDLRAFRINERGTGSRQYPPRIMLSLLIYCYANGIFSSRRIERATYRDVGVRYLTADTHPDHDTIATFRRENFEAVSGCFVEVLELARELKLLKVGMVSVDGTKLKANASKSQNIRYDRSVALSRQLSLEVEELLNRAEEADCGPTDVGHSLPDDLSRLNGLKEKIDAARKRLEERGRARAERERAGYEKKVRARDKREGKRKGKHPKPPESRPEGREQDNMTDPDSRLMRKSKREGYMQAYNPQAVVDAEGSYLVLGSRVSQCASDRNELSADVESIPASLGRPSGVLADNGYLNEKEVEKLAGMEVLVSVHAEAKALRRKHDFRPLPDREKPPPKIRSEFVREMNEKMKRPESRKKYRLRKQTVEPVFGTIKKWMGFDQFLLRGLEKVRGEWQLVTLAYNFRRLWRMISAQNLSA